MNSIACTDRLSRYLPAEILNSLPDLSTAEEIRLRSGGAVSVTGSDGNNIICGGCSRDQLDYTVLRLCGGSLHAHEDSIRNGYISLGDGWRAGVCGAASGGGVRAISSVNIRIPRSVTGISGPLCRRLSGSRSGILIYSPPGVGKTTVLRDAAATLSRHPYYMRVAVIDSRGELYRSDMFSESSADFYAGYSKADGIEIATRTMSPQLIVCDEIGSGEARAIIAAQNCGVPLLASAHADSYAALLRRPDIGQLISSRVFRYIAGINRISGNISFNFEDAATDA